MGIENILISVADIWFLNLRLVDMMYFLNDSIMVVQTATCDPEVGTPVV